jgi:hypothetical protein
VGVVAVLIGTLAVGVAPASASTLPVSRPTLTIDCASLNGDYFRSMAVTAGWSSLTPDASYSLEVETSSRPDGFLTKTIPLTADAQGSLTVDTVLTGKFVSSGTSYLTLYSGRLEMDYSIVTANSCPTATPPTVGITASDVCSTAFTLNGATYYGREHVTGVISGLTPGSRYSVYALSGSTLTAGADGRLTLDQTLAVNGTSLQPGSTQAWSIYAASDARVLASGSATVGAGCPALARATRPRVTHDYDISGDGHADLLAIDQFGGLRYYPNNSSKNPGHLPFSGSIRAGNGWSNQYLPTVGIGDLNGDGFADLLATDNAGRLLYYQNNIRTNANHLPYSRSLLIGSGWKGYKYVQAADLNGDGYADILARRGDDKLFYYPNAAKTHKGSPYFPTKVEIGTEVDGNVALGDMNGDGFADKVMQGWYNGTSVAPNGLPAANASLFDLRYSANTSPSNMEEGYAGIAVGDYEGRGRDGLLVANPNNSGQLVYVKDPFAPGGTVTSQVIGSGWQAIWQLVG